MATKPEEPSILDPIWANGPAADPQYIADRDRDLRMCCIRAAIDINRPGESTANGIVQEAQQILDFVNGSAK